MSLQFICIYCDMFALNIIMSWCLFLGLPVKWRSHIFVDISTGSSLNTIKRTAKFLCPADIIPPYIDVDLSELDVGQKLVMGDLKVHPALKLLQSKDEPVCKIMGARVSDQRRKWVLFYANPDFYGMVLFRKFSCFSLAVKMMVRPLDVLTYQRVY